MAVDQQEIIRRAERIAGIRPSPAATQRAVAEALAAANHRPRSGWTIQQWVLPATGIAAACLVIIIALSVHRGLNPPTPQASLSNVLAKSEHYHGWIELTPETPLNTKLASADPAAKTPVTVSVRSVYVNPAEHAEAYVGEIGTARYAALQRGEHREIYDGRSNTLLVVNSAKGPLLAPDADGPGRLPELLARAREVLTLDPASVRSTRQGSEDRFHLPLPESSAGQAVKAPGLPIHGPIPEGQIADASLERPGMTLWADARTGTLNRVSAVQRGGRWSADLTYGRTVASIYDLGAPQTARPASK